MATTMRAVTWDAPESLRLATIEAPSIHLPTDAVLRVMYASTCGTDLHIYRGAVPGFEPGTVIGHEFVGTVIAAGSALRRIEVGQRVRCSDFVACGNCTQCQAGRHAQCGRRLLFGFSGVQPRLDGGMAEYVRVPWADVTLDPLPERADLRAGLLATDVLPTALGAIGRAKVFNGQRLAIVGAGPVGVLSAFLAGLRGAAVTLVESNAHRAARARGAGYSVHMVDAALPLSESASGLIASFDAAIDAVGGERGLTAALALVRAAGRVVGVGSQAGHYALNWGRIFQREISLHFVIGNPLRLRGELDEAMAACGPVLDLMFSDHVPLAEVPAYFAALYRRERFKAVVHIGSPEDQPSAIGA